MIKHRKKLLASAILLATTSVASNAEMIHTRLGVTSDMNIPHMGISQGDHLFVDYSYDDSMQAINVNPNAADYRPTEGDLQVSINSNKGFISNASNTPGWQSINVVIATQGTINGTPYHMRMDGGKIEFTDGLGNPATEDVTIEVNGLTPGSLQSPELVDLSELRSEYGPSDPLGHIILAGHSFNIQAIDPCPSDGCGDVPESKVKFDITAFNASEGGGFPHNNPVKFQLGYDTLTIPTHSTPSSSQFSTTDFSFSYTIPDTGKQVIYNQNQNAYPSNIFLDEVEESPGNWLVNLYISLNVEVTDEMGNLRTETADLMMNLRGDSSSGGKLPDLSKYEIEQGVIGAPGTQHYSPQWLEISKISESTTDSDDGGPVDTSNLLLSVVEENHFPGPIYGSYIQLSVENPSSVPQNFGLVVEAVFPTGFSWPLELHTIGEFSVSPYSTWNHSMPVDFHHNWASGDYKVRAKLLTIDNGQYATKDLPVTHGQM